MVRPLARLQPLHSRQHAPGFSSAGWRASRNDLDPLLNVDLFRMSEPTFRPHPHAGFSAVTYLLPESPGAFRNRDSRGDASTIHPGSIHWTQAGSGVIHEEVPATPGIDGWGFQVFVALPKSAEESEPLIAHADPDAIPLARAEGSTVRVLAGNWEGRDGAIRGLATPLVMLDVTIEAGASRSFRFDPADRVLLFPIAGEAQVDGRLVTERDGLLFDPGQGVVEVEARRTYRAVVFAGPPTQRPAVWSGPFCLSSDEQVRRAMHRFREGRMGTLVASF